ncbi:25223_t:CDS:2 [Gigaspora rosea]|nr:25223_t:CDS:2 [Gigaspora rosea]
MGDEFMLWANALGGFPDIRDQTADLVFDFNKGLGLNVIRYNIGGGDNQSHHHMRIGGDVPGFQPCEKCDYNWTSDANQRWILFAAKDRGADIFEAFSNRYWCSSGGQNYANNLNSDYYDKFADYLTEVVKWYKDEQGLTFRTLEPFNEPTTGYWKEFGMNAQFCLYTEVGRIAGSQEGCTYKYLAMSEVVNKVGAYLNKKGLSNTTSVSIADEGLFEGEITTIELFLS